MASNRRIKISSSSSIRSENYVFKVTNHNTGKAKIAEKQEPANWESTKTVIGNPEDPENYHSSTKGRNEPPVREVEIPKKPTILDSSEGYDTSQL